MLQTIIINKELSFPELVEYVWSTPEVFDYSDYLKIESNSGHAVHFDKAGFLRCDYPMYSDDKFIVEIEQAVTLDTEFDYMVVVTNGKKSIKTFENTTIQKITELYGIGICINEIHALINGNLVKIYEASEGE